MYEKWGNNLNLTEPKPPPTVEMRPFLPVAI